MPDRPWPRIVEVDGVTHREHNTKTLFTCCRIYFGDGWVEGSCVIVSAPQSRLVSCMLCLAEGA